MKLRGFTELISWSVVIILLMVVLSWFVRDEPKEKQEGYDERQVLARGVAFKWGFSAGLIYLFLVQVALLWEDFPFSTREVIVFGGVLMLGVYMSVCIWKDAYTRPREKEGFDIFTLFNNGILSLLYWSVHKQDWFFFHVGVVFCFDGVLMLLRRFLRKREEREEADG